MSFEPPIASFSDLKSAVGNIMEDYFAEDYHDVTAGIKHTKVNKIQLLLLKLSSIMCLPFLYHQAFDFFEFLANPLFYSLQIFVNLPYSPCCFYKYFQIVGHKFYIVVQVFYFMYSFCIIYILWR